MECTGTYSPIKVIGTCIRYPYCAHYGGAFYTPYFGEAWRQGKPEERKSKRIVLIRSAWQHVVDFEDWVYPIHTIACDQRSVRHGFHQLRRWGDRPPETTQVRLSLMD
jgi:hypothetical protein